MLCENCGKREANTKYSENINGVKKELYLCEKCSKELGIGNLDFSMPLDFSSFFSSILENFQDSSFMPMLDEQKELECKNCGTTFADIINTGKLGCANCYDTFEEQLDPIIKKIHGSNRHVGRLGEVKENRIIKENSKGEENEETSELRKLKRELKQVIKEEKYEEAAKLRDKIAEIEKNLRKDD